MDADTDGIRNKTNVSHLIYTTVKPVLSSHTKIDKTKILMTNGIVAQ